MRAKREANRILTALLMLTAIIAPSVVQPGSYLGIGTASAASICTVAASTGSYGSFGYHDI